VRPFYPGWNSEQVIPAQERLAASGLLTANPFQQDTGPLPPGFSLARFRRWPFNQGYVGTCWCNSTTQAFQILTAADNAAGANWDLVPLSRRFTGWFGKRREGGGNMADGGTVSDAFAAMADQGCCHEELFPYVPDARTLALPPSSAAVADGKLNRVSRVANLELGDDLKRSLVAGHPAGLGIWWPHGWDTPGGTFFDRIGPGSYGHALCVIGWYTKGDALYWQIENSHGPIYAPLPAEDAAQVPGYVPAQDGKTFDFWVRDETLRRVMGYGNAELVTAAGMSGFAGKTISWDGAMV
jgi:hypothetical protein